MDNNKSNLERSTNTDALRSRRAVLKVIAGAPLFLTFGLLASPLMRFLKPTMKPCNFFQSADLPTAARPPQFKQDDLPDSWSCLPFMFPMKYLVFNPQQYEIRDIPGFVIRLATNQVVAYSRICPRHPDHILSYVAFHPTASGSCGCADKTCVGVCIGHSKTPVLVCPYDHSVYDVSDEGRVLSGCASYPARQFIVDRDGDWISISRLENVRIG